MIREQFKLTLYRNYLRYKKIIDNIFFVGLVQIFSLIAPLITYPYLVSVLGMDLYGMVITAQVMVGYATLLIDFGSNSVCAKDIAINHNNPYELSKIVTNVLMTRCILALICFLIYLCVILCIETYRSHLLLYLLSYLLIANELLYPQFFFQGMENLKVSSILNISIKFIFIGLVFVLVKNHTDYLLVPVLYALGYTIAGIVALYIMYTKYHIRFVNTKLKNVIYLFKSCFPLLSTDFICTIKDKWNYILIGNYVGMADVVIYDLGIRISGLICRPANVITTVLFPRFARNRNISKLKICMILIFSLSLIMILMTNFFLAEISMFFLNQEIDLLPLRVMSVIPLFLSLSIFISTDYLIAFAYNKYLLYSIIVTVSAYLSFLIVIWFVGYMNNLWSFIFLAIISYLTELIYRLGIFIKKTRGVN